MQDLSTGEGRTVLFVSHNMASIKNLCTRVLTLENGRKAFEGETNEAIDYYLKVDGDKVNTDLKNRIDRSGNGKVIITKVLFKSLDNGNILESVVTGSNIQIEIHYKLNETDLIGTDLEIGLSFYSRNNHFITVLNNIMVGSPLKISTTIGKIKCNINQFPLTEGLFNIRTVARNKKGIFDLVENATNIYVHKGDYYGHGRINSYGRQGVYINQEWKN